MGGNHIHVSGNNNDTIVDSTVGSIDGARDVRGEPLAAALQAMAAFVGTERNEAAANALRQMELALAKQPSSPAVAQSHWRTLVAALPTIMQIPATMTVIRALFPD